MDIVLTTLNARYAHSAFGLRYLFANLGELKARAAITEFTIQQRPIDVVEALLKLNPRIIGLGVYIWNAQRCARIVSLLKRIRPKVTIVLGGPEVSYEWDDQDLVSTADYLITGEADLAFASLCASILSDDPPAERVIVGGAPSLEKLALPYEFYDDDDVARRVLYVEASRGCPFRCEFCLSSLDRGVRGVGLERFLSAMQQLLDRGAKRFKFVDRTFNLDIQTSSAIVSFFLERLRPDLFLHFEMIPDRLPTQLRDLIARFPPGHLQLEVGIQTFDPEVGRRIRRRQKNDVAELNLRFLAEHTEAHVHADLIVGLPGETIDGFARGFDRLLSLGPQEIQVGILKRLRGTSLGRHDDEWGMVYSADPPYEILVNDAISFEQMQQMKRFARYWDLVANSGNFVRSTPLIWLNRSPFRSFLEFSRWLYQRLGRTSEVSLDRLAESVLVFLTEVRGLATAETGPVVWEDYRLGGRRRRVPPFLRQFHDAAAASGTAVTKAAAGARQARHRAGRPTQSS